MTTIKHRTIPVRTTLVGVGIGFAALNVLAPLAGVVPASDAIVQTVLLLVGVGVGGDTVRPSGMVKSEPP